MTPDFDLFHQVLFLVRRYLERLPGNFVIPFPFIPELLKALIVQGRVCFEGRQQKTKPPELCSALPGGRELLQWGIWGLQLKAGSYHEPTFLWWAGTLPGTFCQLWGQLWHLQGWIPASPPKPSSPSKGTRANQAWKSSKCGKFKLSPYLVQIFFFFYWK